MESVLRYKNYLGTVNYSAEDEVFHGKIFGINDLVTFEGTSVDELKNAFNEAVDDYLRTCVELKKVPEKTFKGTFNVRVSQDLHKKAATAAAARKMTLNEFVANALELAVTTNLIQQGSVQVRSVEQMGGYGGTTKAAVETIIRESQGTRYKSKYVQVSNKRQPAKKKTTKTRQ